VYPARDQDYDWFHHQQYIAPLENRIRELDMKLEQYILAERLRRSQEQGRRWELALKVAMVATAVFAWTMFVLALA
jgi:hypothetical protein